jgi:hypothetical protein
MRVVSGDIGAKNRLDAIGGRRDIPPQRSLQEPLEIVSATRRLNAKVSPGLPIVKRPDRQSSTEELHGR